MELATSFRSSPDKPVNLLSRLAAKVGGIRALAACSLIAQFAVASEIPLANIHIRDPFILPVEQERSYYLVGSGGRSVTVRQSEDLKTWSEPKTVFAIPDGFWGSDAIWAPEIHQYRGRYYLFATFMNKEPVGEQWTNWAPRVHRGTQALVADSPLGPFKPFANRSHTPTTEMALDGTLWVEDETPHMVYCHEWVQVRDGGMKLIRLNEELSAAVGEPQLLFKGSEAPWAPRGRDRYITDGPALYKSKSGKLFMLWSSFSETGYTTGIAISDSGKVEGPWRQQTEPFFREDGGHSMIFRRFDGGLMVALHSPNRSPDERCRLIEVEDTGDTLVPRGNSQAKAADGTQPTEARQPWVLAYFRQRYEGRVEVDDEGRVRQVPLPNPMKEEQLHLALSTDGRHWEPLNDNRPVWDQWLRDPFVGRGSDGLWHLLATGGRHVSQPAQTNLGPTCLYANSRDLLKWDNVRSLHVMQGVRDEAGRPARNIWAPEWFLDQATGEIVLLWSSSFEDAGWKRSRLWFSRTRDWETFTPAKVLFAPPYSVIDGTLVQHGGTYYLFHKEEEFGAKTGERRAIRLATADRLEGPYRIHQGPLNQGQIAPVITEGPAVMPDPEKPGWLLLYDYCMSNGYGVSSSPDLVRWSIEESVSLPPDARHGSVARLTAAEAAALRSSFSENR
jgi:GH43 family beta-xylosidase